MSSSCTSGAFANPMAWGPAASLNVVMFTCMGIWTRSFLWIVGTHWNQEGTHWNQEAAKWRAVPLLPKAKFISARVAVPFRTFPILGWRRFWLGLPGLLLLVSLGKATCTWKNRKGCLEWGVDTVVFNLLVSNFYASLPFEIELGGIHWVCLGQLSGSVVSNSVWPRPFRERQPTWGTDPTPD